MSGGKCIRIFNPKCFWTPGVSFCGLEAIGTKFVGQLE